MTDSWQQFEDDCFNYLNDKYGDKCIFKALGKSDSTKADILAKTRRSTFYIEVKEANAQSGQFVLLPDTENLKFIFSPRNKTKENEFTSIITNYMNKDFEAFNSAGTAGQNLDIDMDIFRDWIIDYYKSKGVRYFITKGADYIIFPTSKFGNYFDITAKYRVKRSGSSAPSKKYWTLIINFLKSENGVTNIINNGKKLFAVADISLSKSRFKIGNYEYYLSPKDKNTFEIRQLSNTYNMNVIFSISLKLTQDPSDLKEFENEF